jgi:hypothetical protein
MRRFALGAWWRDVNQRLHHPSCVHANNTTTSRHSLIPLYFAKKLLGMAPNLNCSLGADMFFNPPPSSTIELQSLQKLLMLFTSPSLPLPRDGVRLSYFGAFKSIILDGCSC